jgi:hypothetical protein
MLLLLRPGPALGLLALLAAPVRAQQTPPFQPLPWVGYEPTAPMDRGRGVVAFSHEPTTLGVVDSLPIHREPARTAPITGYFLQRVQEDSSPYVLTAPAGLTANLLEFGYEVIGLPVDSLKPDSAWARVVYAFDPDRRPQFGWVALDSAAARVVLWTDLLPTQDLFLTDSAPWAFTDQPLGSPVPVAPPPEPHGYVLHPLTTRGPWLQVRVVVPSDMCEDPQPGARSVVVWLRYLDSAGRPRVWFYPRGC